MYNFIIGEGTATLVNMTTGKTNTLTKNDAAYDLFMKLLREKDFDGAEKCGDLEVKVSSFVAPSAEASNGVFSVEVKDGTVMYSFAGMGPYPLHNAIVNRILKMADAGFDVNPLVKFMTNLLGNPSKTAIDEAYLFAEACQLPITEDGYLIAYKIVGDDYMDLHSHSIRNAVGDKPEMKRCDVDDNRNNTCSSGLHFCSKGYLPSYGKMNGDRCMLLKINPADIVSIPSDYNNAKGRAWKYEVVGEVASAEWRQELSNSDFTTSPVVTPTATEVIKNSNWPSMLEVFNEFFYIDTFEEEAHWIDTGNFASMEHVVNKLVKKAHVHSVEAHDFYFDILDNEDLNGQKDHRDEQMWEHIENCGYSFNHSCGRWENSYNGIPILQTDVMNVTGYNSTQLHNLIHG